MKCNLKLWNQTVFGCIDKAIEEKTLEIESLDKVDNTLGLDELNMIRRKKNMVESKISPFRRLRSDKRRRPIGFLKVTLTLIFFHNWIEKETQVQ